MIPISLLWCRSLLPEPSVPRNTLHVNPAKDQPDGETFSFCCAFGEKLEVLSFLLTTQDLGAHFISSSTPSKPPKGACLIHSLQPETTPGYQAPVRPQPEPRRRKLRTSYFSETKQQKEKVSPSGVREATSPKNFTFSSSCAPSPSSPLSPYSKTHLPPRKTAEYTYKNKSRTSSAQS